MAKPKAKKPHNAPLNFVHLYDVQMNRSAVHKDKRKADKQGQRKHKSAWINHPSDFSIAV